MKIWPKCYEQGAVHYPAQTKASIIDYVEVFYNRVRGPSSLGYR